MSTYPNQVHLLAMTAADELLRNALIRAKWNWDRNSDLILLDQLQIHAQWNTFEK